MRVCEADLQLLVLDVEGDLLKAKLPLRCEHPRALVTVLEGLAMWQGGKLDAVHFVDARAPGSTDWAFSNADLHGHRSPLVAFSTRVHGRAKDRLRGVGDFRQTYARVEQPSQTLENPITPQVNGGFSGAPDLSFGLHACHCRMHSS